MRSLPWERRRKSIPADGAADVKASRQKEFWHVLGTTRPLSLTQWGRGRERGAAWSGEWSRQGCPQLCGPRSDVPLILGRQELSSGITLGTGGPVCVACAVLVCEKKSAEEGKESRKRQR